MDPETSIASISPALPSQDLPHEKSGPQLEVQGRRFLVEDHTDHSRPPSVTQSVIDSGEPVSWQATKGKIQRRLRMWSYDSHAAPTREQIDKTKKDFAGWCLCDAELKSEDKTVRKGSSFYKGDATTFRKEANFGLRRFLCDPGKTATTARPMDDRAVVDYAYKEIKTMFTDDAGEMHYDQAIDQLQKRRAAYTKKGEGRKLRLLDQLMNQLLDEGIQKACSNVGDTPESARSTLDRLMQLSTRSHAYRLGASGKTFQAWQESNVARFQPALQRLREQMEKCFDAAFDDLVQTKWRPEESEHFWLDSGVKHTSMKGDIDFASRGMRRVLVSASVRWAARARNPNASLEELKQDLEFTRRLFTRFQGAEKTLYAAAGLAIASAMSEVLRDPSVPQERTDLISSELDYGNLYGRANHLDRADSKFLMEYYVLPAPGDSSNSRYLGNTLGRLDPHWNAMEFPEVALGDGRRVRVNPEKIQAGIPTLPELTPADRAVTAEDLPKTVEKDNYARTSDAFMQRLLLEVPGPQMSRGAILLRKCLSHLKELPEEKKAISSLELAGVLENCGDGNLARLEAFYRKEVLGEQAREGADFEDLIAGRLWKQRSDLFASGNAAQREGLLIHQLGISTDDPHDDGYLFAACARAAGVIAEVEPYTDPTTPAASRLTQKQMLDGFLQLYTPTAMVKTLREHINTSIRTNKNKPAVLMEGIEQLAARKAQNLTRTERAEMQARMKTLDIPEDAPWFEKLGWATMDEMLIPTFQDVAIEAILLDQGYLTPVR